MANITTPIAAGDNRATAKTKIIAIIENWRGAGFASGGNTPATWGAARTLLNSVAALVVLTAIGANDSGATARAKINALNDDTAGGRFTGSSLDLQFAANKAYGAADPLAPLTVTRASAGMVEDASGNWTSVGNNVARRSDKGLLVEEARTNQLRNNALAGIVAGSPGTMPTYWNTTLGILNREVIGTVVEKGVECLVIRFSGVPSATSVIAINCDSLALTIGDVVTNSAFVKLQAGTLTNTTDFAIRAANEGGQTVFTPDGVLRRVTNTRTLAATSAAPTIRFNCVDTVTPVDFTLLVGWPQLELGAFVTSPIRTTGAAATRAADNIVISNPANYTSISFGSMLTEWEETINPPYTVSRVTAALRVDGTNLIRQFISVTGFVATQTTTAGVSQAIIGSMGTVAAGSVYKTAFRWGTNDFAAKVSSSISPSGANDTSGTTPSGTFTLAVGSVDGTGGHLLNSYIRRIVLFPTAQNDAALNAMVT